MKRFNKYLIPVFAVILCLGLIFQTGCSGLIGKYSGPNINGYRLFTMDEGIAHFSFSYPAEWKVWQAKLDDKSTHVALESIDFIKDEQTITATIVSMSIYEPNNVYPDAKTNLEGYIRSVKNWEGYIFIEQSNLKIDGVDAEQVEFSYLSPTSNQGPATEPTIVQQIYFNHAGYVWSIWAASHADIIARDKSGTDRILSSFKLLD